MIEVGSGTLHVGDAAEMLGKVEPGSIRLCYLDPPYNGGRAIRNYRDRQGRDEWYDDMVANLTALRPLLTAEGSVWLHLDDAEQHRGRMALDEVFGPKAFLATIVWQKRQTRENRSAFSNSHEYIHVYSPAGKGWVRHRNGVPDEGVFANPDGDPRGPWRSVPATAQRREGRDAQWYTVTTPTGVQHEPPAGRCWTYTEPRFAELVAEGRVHWPSGGDGRPRLKHYESESSGLAPFTIWLADEVGTTGEAKKDILAMFGAEVFDTPKPVRLLEHIIKIGTNPGDRVLDYYLGSGTTAVAAENLGRQWVGVERNPETVEKVTLRRIRDAIERREGDR